MLLETLASRSGRLTSSALRVVTARSTGKPCAGSSRTVPLADSSPLRAVWKAQPLQLQRVALQRQVRLAAAQPQAGVGQGQRGTGQRHRAGAGDGLAVDGQREVGTQACPATPRTLVPSAGENGARSSATARALTASARCLGEAALPLTARLVAAARRQPGIERRLLADQRCAALQRQRRQQRRLRPLDPHAVGDIGRLDARRGDRRR